MSYRCEDCKTIQPPKTKPYRLAVQTETVIYPFRSKVNQFKTDGGWETRDDPGGRGWQIVRELVLCHWCFVDQKSRLDAGGYY